MEMKKSKLLVLRMYWVQQLGKLTKKAKGKDYKLLAPVMAMDQDLLG